MTKLAISRQINQLKNLPALPEASLRILSAINNPVISPDELANVLGLSPSLVARLLGLANAAYFGQSRKINDLPTAIYQVLGLDLVKSLALSIILNVQFDTAKCLAFDSLFFWQQSLLTAVAAQKIAQANKYKQNPPATVYTCGLLLQLGILMLAYLAPVELNNILRPSDTNSLSVSDAIVKQFGSNHYHLAYLLMHKWQLSPVYQSVQKNYVDQQYIGEDKALINIITVAQHISSMLVNENFNEEELLQVCQQQAIASNSIIDIVDYLIENQQNIQNLAEIIGN